MKLFKISQTENQGWDTYDSAIVAANTIAGARAIHPSGNQDDWERPNGWQGTWCRSPEDVTVVVIGKAKVGTKRGVILASFNAG